MMNDLINHIKSINQKTTDWVNESPTTRFAGLYCDDPKHWADYGITTIDQFEHYILVTEVFELTRSAFGYKPSWAGLMSLTTDDLKADRDRLSNYLNTVAETERKEEEDHNRIVSELLTQHSGWSIGQSVN